MADILKKAIPFFQKAITRQRRSGGYTAEKPGTTRLSDGALYVCLRVVFNVFSFAAFFQFIQIRQHLFQLLKDEFCSCKFFTFHHRLIKQKFLVFDL